jgi:hypothetical protein
MASIKYILTLLIIIFSLSMSAQNYIKVLPQAGLTSEQRAEAISYELWAISRPPAIRNPNDVTTYLFGWVKHPTQDSTYTEIVNTALEVDLNYNIIVHPENNLTNLIALFPELSQAEKDALAAFIESQQSFEFRYIVPGGVTVYTKEQMEENGWFPKIEELQK